MIENLTFEKEKLRDTVLRKQFYELLDKIHLVQQKNSYLGYVENEQLFDNLVTVYKTSTGEYEKNYLPNYKKYKALKIDFENQKQDIHKEHWEELNNRLHEIETLLIIEDFNKNELTKNLINEFVIDVKFYKVEFKKFIVPIEKLENFLVKTESLIWAEDFDMLKSKIENYKGLVSGHKSPDSTILEVNNDLIEKYIADKQRNLLGLSRRLKNSGASCSYEELNKFCKSNSSKREFDRFCQTEEKKKKK
jgi:hypothetical protein